MTTDPGAPLAVEVVCDAAHRNHAVKPHGGWQAPLRFRALWLAALRLWWNGELTLRASAGTRYTLILIRAAPSGDYLVIYRYTMLRCATALDALRLAIVEFDARLDARKVHR